MLLATLGASMLGNMMTGKGVMGVGYHNIDNVFSSTPSFKPYRNY